MPVNAEPTTIRVDLMELLAEQPIVHPTRVERVTICGDRMEMVVSGYPWWLGGQASVPSPRITLIFENLSEGALPVHFDNQFSEDLEVFSIEPLATIEWAQSSRNDIYCHAPLPDPARIYSMLQAFLAGVGAFKGPGDFLNQGCLLEGFTKVTSDRSYLLARAPDVLCRLLCDELDRQLVPHNVLQHSPWPESRLWVRLEGAGFLCGSAWAEFEA
jgi:hypothetical protein